MPAHRSALTIDALDLLQRGDHTLSLKSGFLLHCRPDLPSAYTSAAVETLGRSCSSQYRSISTQYHAVCALFKATSTGFTADKLRKATISKMHSQSRSALPFC